MQLNLSTPQTISVNMYDMQGRLVAAQRPALYNTASIINLNGTANLKPGTYILRLNAGTEQLVYKIVKQ